ncbi:MAG: phosphoserine transaminase [Candidatus Fischerbacteria bacterium RBG_13_37_8]|uniref:Phosphoserine aminotransferase n=1 Tax=Candidatus Fischerbacteria bacterium RBG_13_37_8 TaxID=1817863 RepID=A0A1F5VSS5_9BACT|nr:MAG: phosphoserine transaminase [Candidatus Fischerbacteria bacterium RBG_13_37_8]
MMRKYNFNPGPAVLPEEALKKAQADLLDFNKTGMSIMEISHRSKDFEAVINGAESKLRSFFGIPDNYSILFLQGGASLQFGMVPMNLLKGGKADYINTGSWAKKAIKEAKLFGSVNIAGSSEDAKFTYIPEKLTFSPDAEYVHLTSNETIEGTQWAKFPDTGNIPLIADMSSDILSRRIDVSKFGLIYAGAQKNIGPAGVTVVIIRNDLIEKSADNLVTMLSYKTHAKEKSLYNTPPCFAIYIVKLVMDWIEEKGGLAGIEETNNKKAKLLYDAIDGSNGYYKGTANAKDRSKMNVTFRLPSEALEEKFINESKAAGLIGLKGHRSVGGCRASIYNALTLEGVKALVDFMEKFAVSNK